MAKKKASKKFDKKNFFANLNNKCDYEGGIIGMEWYQDELREHFHKQYKMFKQWQELESLLNDWIEENNLEGEEYDR